MRADNLRSGRTKSCGCRLCKQFGEMMKTRRNNTSSVIGVEWLTCRKRWKATICFNRKRCYLGEYEAFEDAVEARRRADKSREQTGKALQENFLHEFLAVKEKNADDVGERSAG